MTTAEVEKLIIVETGELIEPMTPEEASSITTQISVKLDAIADNYESVMPMIREAITRQAHVALGYASPGAYVQERFSRALSRLGVDMRRDVVRELSEAGLSTRAIAPVVGVSHKTVVKDLQVVPEVPPDRRASQDVTDVVEPESVADNDHVLTDDECAALAAQAGDEVPSLSPALEPKSTGLDGKQYGRKRVRAPRRQKPITDEFRSSVTELEKSVKRITKLSEDNRFNSNADQIKQSYCSDLVRARDALQCVIDQLTN